ncbi:MAG: radical SAM family heme chaperone HemW [Desulfobacterales bacterium]|jgi:oxygen-independent coproporphyrinogen-3 oxidase
MFQDPPSSPLDTPFAGLYIHIPFCFKKCPYCDFYSITDPSLQPRFRDALISEMNMVDKNDLVYDTLYIGGGTPSVLDDAVLKKVIDTAGQCFNILSDAETTLEVNPGTVTMRQLKNYRQAGINRISIGIQSFNPENLDFLGRIHSVQEAENAVKWAQKAGFENIGLDLIYGIPGQTDKLWLKDLQTAVDLRPQHLSCYMLSYEPGTPLHMDLQNRAFTPLPEQRICELYEIAVTFLNTHHYVQYETSNFARKDAGSRGTQSVLTYASRHNMKYWNFVPYTGLGPSAHSFMDQKRLWNHSSVEKYIEELSAGRLPRAGEELLNREQQWMENVYLGLRQTKGIAVDAIEKKFGINFNARYAGVIADLEEKGLIKSSKERCALTSRGMLYLDAIAGMFI